MSLNKLQAKKAFEQKYGKIPSWQMNWFGRWFLGGNHKISLMKCFVDGWESNSKLFVKIKNEQIAPNMIKVIAESLGISLKDFGWSKINGKYCLGAKFGTLQRLANLEIESLEKKKPRIIKTPLLTHVDPSWRKEQGFNLDGEIPMGNKKEVIRYWSWVVE